MPPTRLAGPSAAASGATRRCEVTGPAFCDSPVWSTPCTASPSRTAAEPSTWLTVTMPVPPIPARNTSAAAGRSTSGTAGGSGRSPGEPERAAPDGSSTVTNDGQSPARQE